MDGDVDMKKSTEVFMVTMNDVLVPATRRINLWMML
jgi:hypothetical protein